MDERQMQAFQLMDEFARFAAFVTVAKQQLIDLGWSDEAAEQIVLNMVRGNR